MHKSFLYLIAIFFNCNLSAQNTVRKSNALVIEKDNNKELKIKKHFQNAELLLTNDDIYAAQKQLNLIKKLISNKEIDTTIVFIHSLQSELFYYNGLYQFGINEAEKCITKAKFLKDSLLIANGYFFKGINLFELKKNKEAEKSLWKSKQFQPNFFIKTHLRSTVEKEHIYNNLAQLKIEMQQLDSAKWYNKKAYFIAKKNKSKRGLPNIEQTFGQIYIKQNVKDSAVYYLNKSIESALKSNFYDIVLIDYSFLMHAFTDNIKELNQSYANGKRLIQKYKINNAFQLYFFKTAIESLKKTSQPEKLLEAQEKLICINDKIESNENYNTQQIIEEYTKNESKLIQQELDLIKSQKEKQLYFIVSLGLILFSFGIWYFFKQRQKFKNQEIETLKQQQEIAKLEALIDGEEKERRRIAQELHDGLNGDLSAIKYRLSTLEESGLSAIDTENLSKVINMIDESCAQVRSISHNLMPSSILEYGLIETIREYCIKINTSDTFKIDFQFFGNYIALSKKTETVIYRIIQELVTNILKHSKATEALIQFNYREDELFITVEDNGIGFDKKVISPGIGHKNIKTRIDFLNAQLDVDSSSTGTSCTISIDLNKVK